MNARLEELTRYIDEQAAVLRAAYNDVPAERRGTRPAPDRWSAAENVQHVIVVERRLVRALQMLTEQARALEPERDESSVLSTIDTARVTERRQRFVTSALGEPTDADPARVWDDFAVVRQALKDVIAAADGLQLGAVRAPHPALGELNGYEWLAFAGAHAARHAAQIREDCR